MRRARAFSGPAIVAILATLAVSCNDNSEPAHQSVISEPQKTSLGELPANAAIIFSSMRWQPDRKEFVPWELYVMDEDGGNVTQITFGGHSYSHAAVSPDHHLLAAARHENEGTPKAREVLWLFDLTQKTAVQLVPDFATAGVGGVDWSRDGHIYFSGKSRKWGNQDIYRIRPNGTGLTNLTETPEDEFDVSVSNDGTLVAYNHLKSRWLQRKPEIWVMRSDGSQKRMIYDGGAEWGKFGAYPIGSFDPEISPDNKKIVFSTTHTRHNNFGVAGGQEICVMNLDQSGFVRFPCPRDGICMIPDWKDDLILFTKYGEKEGYVGLATMSSDGKNERMLEKNLKQLWDGGRHGKWIAPLDPSWPYPNN